MNKVAQKCFQLATKSNGRPQQLQFCRLPSGAATEKALWPIRRRVGGTMRSLDDEARSADRVGTSATDVSCHVDRRVSKRRLVDQQTQLKLK